MRASKIIEPRGQRDAGAPGFVLLAAAFAKNDALCDGEATIRNGPNLIAALEAEEGDVVADGKA